MKILHTSDWHLGHTLYNYDRTEEQLAMIEQMADIVREQKPDVFLLCGDVYHTSQPSAAVQTMFTNAIVKIHVENPKMVIVVTAGNHDSGTKHEIFRTPWAELGVHAIGTLNKENPEDHIVEIPGKGYVLAVPYASERNIPDGFFQQLQDAVAEKNADGLPVVMSAHTTVKGCDFTGHEHGSEYTVGGIDSFDVERLGDGYDYLALGHIHREQFVHTGKHNVRYSGTPISVSFDEDFEHSVSIVEIVKHGETPKVTKIGIQNPRPLVTLPKNGSFTSWENAKKLLREFPDESPAYIRLNVEVDDFLPAEANAEAEMLTCLKECRFCHINAKRKGSQKSDSKALSVQELQSEEPIEIARQYAEDHCIAFDEEMKEVFNETLRLLNENARNE